MEHHEPFIAEIVNHYIANPIAGWFGYHPHGDHSGVLPGHLVMIIIAFLFLTVFSLWLRRRLSVDSPGGVQQAIELTIQGLRGLAHDVIGAQNRRYFPLLGGLFFYILACNWMGQIPGFAPPTANFNIPVSMAICSFLYYNFHGVRVHGPVKYLIHFAGPVLALSFIVFPIEIVSHAARVASLSIRLFGNLFAEELVTGSLASIFPFIVPLPTVLLGLFAGLIQAFVFVLLTMVYIGEAVAEEH
ncbi:MAG TPA: F0F1 ATP synthase subunit A [Acidobacteriota bacterium]|nr:F0F1 ATP synthase subunit A [Acidobacteriota bacterium]